MTGTAYRVWYSENNTENNTYNFQFYVVDPPVPYRSHVPKEDGDRETLESRFLMTMNSFPRSRRMAFAATEDGQPLWNSEYVVRDSESDITALESIGYEIVNDDEAPPFHKIDYTDW